MNRWCDLPMFTWERKRESRSRVPLEGKRREEEGEGEGNPWNRRCSPPPPPRASARHCASPIVDAATISSPPRRSPRRELPRLCTSLTRWRSLPPTAPPCLAALRGLPPPPPPSSGSTDPPVVRDLDRETPLIPSPGALRRNPAARTSSLRTTADHLSCA